MRRDTDVEVGHTLLDESHRLGRAGAQDVPLSASGTDERPQFLARLGAEVDPDDAGTGTDRVRIADVSDLRVLMGEKPDRGPANSRCRIGGRCIQHGGHSFCSQRPAGGELHHFPNLVAAESGLCLDDRHRTARGHDEFGMCRAHWWPTAFSNASVTSCRACSIGAGTVAGS